jgi:hypothetical protein
MYLETFSSRNIHINASNMNWREYQKGDLTKKNTSTNLGLAHFINDEKSDSVFRILSLKSGVLLEHIFPFNLYNQ